MLIIAGKLYIDPEDREKRLASLDTVIRRARTQPGCLDCVVAADPVEPGRVNQSEHRESEEHFATGQAVVDSPEFVTACLSEGMKKYEIGASGPVFT